MKTESKNAKDLHDGRKFSYEKVAEYHKKYIDSETGLVKKGLITSRTCPACGENDFNQMFIKSGGTYVKCNKCLMVYLNPLLKQDVLNEYYTNLNTGQYQVTEKEKDFYYEIYSIGLNKIEKFSAGGKLLDIGCSSGYFLDVSKERNWETYGIELGVEEADMAKAKGHILFDKLIHELETDVKFDAISMWDVFEHIPDSVVTLNSIAKFLNPQGVFFMQIPNSGSLATRIMHQDSRMFDGIEHVNLYNPRTVHHIADRCGFVVLSLDTVISEISVTNNYMNYNHPYFGTDSISFLGDIINESKIHELLMGYKMQVVLRKK